MCDLKKISVSLKVIFFFLGTGLILLLKGEDSL